MRILQACLGSALHEQDQQSLPSYSVHSEITDPLLNAILPSSCNNNEKDLAEMVYLEQESIEDN